MRVKDEILTLAREQNAAIKNHDRTALERIYAPEFFMVHAYGYVDSRAEHIDQLLARDATDLIPLPTFTPPEELNVYGDVAVHRYTAHFGRSSFRGPLPPDLALELARQIAASFAISPDGRRMAFVAERDGQPTLWVRDLDLRE